MSTNFEKEAKDSKEFKDETNRKFDELNARLNEQGLKILGKVECEVFDAEMLELKQIISTLGSSSASADEKKQMV